MTFPLISSEQNDIIMNMVDKNIIVDSVAGSGKTTTNIYIAKHFNDKNILLLTYNAKLKIETRLRIKNLAIKNLECHSYHSFCVKYYDNKCFTDSEIKKVVTGKCKARKFSYDIIILDEAQDITNLYYELICKITNDNNGYAKICLLGDRHQSIYDFNKADERYLTYADKIFKFNDIGWGKCNLATSFRITTTMADFINECMLGYKRINAIKKSEHKPRYIICKIFPGRSDYQPFNEFKYYLAIGYKPHEIFVLAPSIKSQLSPVRMFENYIKTKLPDIPIYVPSSDESSIDDEVVADKLIFSTFHQAKGLERKVVIIFGFDDSYFKYYKREATTCPNELYVACTRGLERLSLIHSDTNNFLPFIDKLDKYTVFMGSIKSISAPLVDIIIDVQVTDLLKHLPAEVIDECMKYLNITKIREPGDKINISHKVNGSKTIEEVSEINGVAIPAYYEYHRTGKMSILEWCMKPNIDKKYTKLIDFWKKHSKELSYTNLKENLLRISSLYCSLRSGYIFKSEQITNYNWIDYDDLDKCMKRFDDLNISPGASYEKICTKMLPGRKLCGSVDCVDGDIMYEFKCVDKLEKTHYLQLAIYMHMSDCCSKYLLFNVLTGEIDEIKCKPDELKAMINYLVHCKYGNAKLTDDAEFLRLSKNIYQGYYKN